MAHVLVLGLLGRVVRLLAQPGLLAVALLWHSTAHGPSRVRPQLTCRTSNTFVRPHACLWPTFHGSSTHLVALPWRAVCCPARAGLRASPRGEGSSTAHRPRSHAPRHPPPAPPARRTSSSKAVGKPRAVDHFIVVEERERAEKLLTTLEEAWVLSVLSGLAGASARTRPTPTSGNSRRLR